MKKRWMVLVLLMVLLTVSGAATAQPQKPATARTVYSMTDANGDTIVSVTEHAAFWQGRFKDIDADKDGKLTAAEFEAATQEFFGNMDEDQNGSLVAKEYLAFWCGPKAGVPAKIKAKSKKKLDANKDGKIGDDECVVFWSANFFDVDANHDGLITRDEFTAAMSRRFKEIDKNRNGFISFEEHAYFMSKNAGTAKKTN